MPPRRCKGTTLSGRACRRTTSNPGGWCGNCSGRPTGPASPADALYSFDGDRGYPSSFEDDPFDLDWGLNDIEDAAASPDGHTRSRVAMSASTPDYILDRLAGDKDPDVVAAVAANAATPARTLERLAAGTRNTGILMSVAANVAANAEVLDAVASRQQEDFAGIWGISEAFETVARHRNTRPDTLDRLASNEDPDVRAAVAQSASVPAETLDRLAGDENPDVRAQVAANPRTRPATKAHAGLLSN